MTIWKALLTVSVRSRAVVDAVADEIKACDTHIANSGMFADARFYQVVQSIFERNSMTRFREPTLVDLLNDPIIHLVMRADQVSTTDILNLYCTGDDTPEANPPAYICSRLLESANSPEA